jgi:hypothetical protein
MRAVADRATLKSMLRVLSFAVLVVVLAGCGGASTTPTATSMDRLHANAVGNQGLKVCALVPVGEVERTVHVTGLRAEPNESLDLSQCRYATDDVNVRIVLDSAAQAELRYFDQQAEGVQKFVRDPSLRPRDVPGVGDDSTPGSAGAYWTPARNELVAIADQRIARITVHVPGRGQQALKEQAAALGRQLFAAIRAQG